MSNDHSTPYRVKVVIIGDKGHPYTCRFAANFLCRGNRQIGTHLPWQKRQSQNTIKELFWGAFPKTKMHLFIKFSARPYIQLEMGLKPANFVPIPSQNFFFKKWY